MTQSQSPQDLLRKLAEQNQKNIVREITSAKGKGIVIAVILIAAMSLLMARLVWLQILQNHYYKTMSVANSTRVTFLRAPRGLIYDRHGNLIATNKQSLSLTAVSRQIPEDGKELTALALRLAKVLDQPALELYERLKKAKLSNSVVPVVIERDLELKTVGRFF